MVRELNECIDTAKPLDDHEKDLQPIAELTIAEEVKEEAKEEAIAQEEVEEVKEAVEVIEEAAVEEVVAEEVAVEEALKEAEVEEVKSVLTAEEEAQRMLKEFHMEKEEEYYKLSVDHRTTVSNAPVTGSVKDIKV